MKSSDSKVENPGAKQFCARKPSFSSPAHPHNCKATLLIGKFARNTTDKFRSVYAQRCTYLDRQHRRSAARLTSRECWASTPCSDTAEAALWCALRRSNSWLKLLALCCRRLRRPGLLLVCPPVLCMLALVSPAKATFPRKLFSSFSSAFLSVIFYFLLLFLNPI